MIQLGDASIDVQALLRSSGFVWWYLDLVDPDGTGLVLIWSYGLPMVPGVAASERRGTLPCAGQRPVLNLATYAGGHCTSYHLQAFDPSQVGTRGPGSWQLGRSSLSSHTQRGQRIVRAELDLDIPGSAERLRGTVRAASPEVRLDGRGGPTSPHQWRPLGVGGMGQASLHAGDWSWSMAGRSYHDRNSSAVSLGALGISRWVWGRVPVPGGERIYYLVWPSGDAQPVAWGLEVDATGQTSWRDVAVTPSRPRSGWFGMQWWAELNLMVDGRPWLAVQHDPPLDDGPFYLRFTTRVRTPDGATHRGVGEALEPGRRDNWARPLTEMAVLRPQGASSMWLPLFSGPARTRWSRLAAEGVPVLRPMRGT